jgi:hypothetical protein
MSQLTHVELDLPKTWKNFKIPPALDQRLQQLLDLQDSGKKLSRAEKSEAEALVELNDLLSALKLQVRRAGSERK